MTGTGGRGDGVAHGPAHGGAPDPRWAPGEQILWRYRDNAPGLSGPVHICRPVTVVQDTAELLAVWMAPGTECVKPVLADGTPVHEEPLATRYTAPRTTVRSRWFGAGVLKLARPGEPWSVWLFWEHGWRFKNWYVNLEEPRTRWSGGVDSVDHFLDISVYPDRSWVWRDEDEFAQARRVGLVDPPLARRVQEAGRAALEVVKEWGPPFRDGWQDWRPDPVWPVPVLPGDWDRTPAHMTS
ncbi:cytidylyl-2-hydroxypropylphosphonate hydrolase [Streptomyces sp. NPDC054838]